MGRWLLSLSALLLTATPVEAFCPWGSYAPKTLSELTEDAEAVLLVEYLDSKFDRDENSPGSSTVLALKFLRPPSLGWNLSPGSYLTLPFALNVMPHELLLVKADRNETGDLEWQFVSQMSPRSFEYLRRIPSIDPTQADLAERMNYFLFHAHSSDETIADDALLEFDRFELSQREEFGRKMSPEWLRVQLARENLAGETLVIDLQLLGFCGQDDDAAFLLDWLTKFDVDKNIRGWSDAATSYLLLTGDRGLRELSKQLAAELDAPFAKRYGFRQSLESMHSNFPGRIEEELLSRALAEMLPYEDMQDLVINTFAGWQDWSTQDRIIAIGERSGVEVMQRAVVRYLQERCRGVRTAINAEQIQAAEQALESLYAKSADLRKLKEFDRLIRLNDNQDDADSPEEMSYIPVIWDKGWLLEQP